MAFSTICNTKGCSKLMEPYLDQKTNKVYCSLCDNEIVNITHFVKMQMMGSKQFGLKQPKAFSVKCNKCNAQEKPKIVSDEVVCGRCSKPLDNISPIYKNMLKSLDKDV